MKDLQNTWNLSEMLDPPLLSICYVICNLKEEIQDTWEYTSLFEYLVDEGILKGHNRELKIVVICDNNLLLTKTSAIEG